MINAKNKEMANVRNFRNEGVISTTDTAAHLVCERHGPITIWCDGVRFDAIICNIPF